MRRKWLTALLGRRHSHPLTLDQRNDSDPSIANRNQSARITIKKIRGWLGRRKSAPEIRTDAIQTTNEDFVNDSSVSPPLLSVKDPSKGSFNDMLHDLAALEQALQKVKREFAKNISSVREAFRRLDGRSYGYVSIEKFRLALDDPSMFPCENLTSHEKDILCEFVDEEGRGKLDYRQFFKLVCPATVSDGESSLRQVIIICRHGARFPLKPFPLATSWPKHPLFWQKYGGKLTPTGQHQMFDLGQRLAEYYLHGRLEPLFTEDDPKLPQEVYAYTSNSDRTLTSAQSVLLGLLPNVAQSFSIEPASDHLPIVSSETKGSKTLNGSRSGPQYQHISIHLADMSRPYCALLHGFKENASYDAVKKDAFKMSKEFHEWAADPRYDELLQKLWRMTGFAKLDPCKYDKLHRLHALQTLSQQIAVERAHHMHVFANIYRLTLAPHDELLIQRVANHICRLRYQGVDHNMQRRMSRMAAGTLPYEVLQSMKNVVEGRSQRKLTLYSAHDNTLMALLSHLGFSEWPIPQFGAHIIFELHFDRNTKSWFVRFAYLDNYEIFPTELRFVKLPLCREIIEWASAESGDVQWNDFEELILNGRLSMRSESEWLLESKAPINTSVNELSSSQTDKEFYKVDLGPENDSKLAKRRFWLSNLRENQPQAVSTSPEDCVQFIWRAKDATSGMKEKEVDEMTLNSLDPDEFEEYSAEMIEELH